MDELRAREEDDLPARLREAVAPVGLLAEEEEVLVERPDLLDRLAPDEHDRAHHELGLEHRVVVEAARVEPVQRPRPRRELAQEEVLGREPPQRREAAHGALQRAVRVQRGAARRQRRPACSSAKATSRSTPSPTTHASALRISTKRAGASAHARVPAGAEPEVLLLDDANLREALAHEVDRRRRSSRGRRRPSRAARRSPGTARSRAARCTSRRRPRRPLSHPERSAARAAETPRPGSRPPAARAAIVTRKKRKPVANAASALDAELRQEADEERLAHGEAVDRERDEHDEEEQRPHHVVRPRREVDADRLARRARSRARAPPGRRASARTRRRAARRGRGSRGCPRRRRGAAARRAAGAGAAAPGERPTRRREKRANAEHDRRDDEGELDPEVGADVVVADREREADRGEHERRGAAERALEQHRPRDRPAVARVAPRRLVDARSASPPIEVGSTWPAVYETK